jgi:hypothetical protein
VRLLACAVLGSLALLTACGADGQHAAWDGPPDPSPDGTVAVDEFVEHAENVDELWERSPVMAAAEFLRLDERTAARTTVEGQAGAEGSGPTTVVVTLDGLTDDSVRAERWTLSFEPNGDVYELAGASWAQQCQPGRGHQDFSPEPCI